jgi:HD-GYP domain-containing protein (c-di-GMP phosphodiesterase class II)
MLDSMLRWSKLGNHGRRRADSLPAPGVGLPPAVVSSGPRASEEWVGLVRTFALLTLIPAVWLGIIPLSHSATNGIIVLLGVYVILMTIGPRWIAGLRRADLGIVLDLIMISLVVIISGNLNSPFLFLYYLTILEAAIRLELRQALAASMAMTGVIILLWTYAGRGELLATPGFQLGAFTAGGFFLALFLGTLIHEHRSGQELARAYDSSLDGWSRALDLRDKETEGHTRRVTDMTLRLARAMGVPEADLVNIRRGSLLHDIGKMGIPDSILLKPGPLTDDEWKVMRRHPVYAYDFLSPTPYLRPALDIPYCHHEKWDGTGYPRGLRGEEIPRAARIFAVADVWDALRSDRPYRAAWTAEKAREYIRDQTGKHFDPRVVVAFLRIESQGA